LPIPHDLLAPPAPNPFENVNCACVSLDRHLLQDLLLRQDVVRVSVRDVGATPRRFAGQSSHLYCS